MLSLCKTVLGFSDNRRKSHHRCRNIPSLDGGGLRLLAEDPPRKVVESAAVRPREMVDIGLRGLLDQNGDRLGLCTESLGCESCEMGMDDGEVTAPAAAEEAELEEEGMRSRRRRRRERSRCHREEVRFPPPLPWLAGGRSAFLKGARRDGRFVLTEVTIERREIFRASRQDGRLRLEIAGPEVAVAAAEEEKDRRGERSEGIRRCQEAVSGNQMAIWCPHRFATIA